MDANAFGDKTADAKAPQDAAPTPQNWVQKAASTAYDEAINLLENPYVDAALLGGAMTYGLKSSMVSVSEDVCAQTVRAMGKSVASDAESDSFKLFGKRAGAANMNETIIADEPPHNFYQHEQPEWGQVQFDPRLDPNYVPGQPISIKETILKRLREED